MIKRIPKILKLIFVLIFVFQLIGLAVLFAWPEITQAADINFKPQITIPGFDTEAKNAGMQGNETSGYSINGNSIGALIKSIYKYAIGIVGILATIVMMIGGFMWLIAGGNQSKISEAQEWIKASLTGLVLALGSYMILATINPALVMFKSLDIKTVYELGCCQDTSSTCSSKSQTSCEGTKGTWKGSNYGCNNTNGKCEVSSQTVKLSSGECFDNSDCQSKSVCSGAVKESAKKGKCLTIIYSSSTCTQEIKDACKVNGAECVVSNGKAGCLESSYPISTTYK